MADDLELPAGITLNGGDVLGTYEKGTWTPAISFGLATTGITYHANTAGTYTRTGDHVVGWGRIRLTSKGSESGIMRITGLPYNPASGDGSITVMASSGVTGAGPITGNGNADGFAVSYWTTGGNTTDFLDTNATDTMDIIFTFQYQV